MIKFKCKGVRKNGKPCNTLFFKAEMFPQSLVYVRCHNCNADCFWGQAQTESGAIALKLDRLVVLT